LGVEEKEWISERGGRRGAAWGGGSRKRRSARPPKNKTKNQTPKPPRERALSAASISRTILAACASDREPPKTVKSCAKT